MGTETGSARHVGVVGLAVMGENLALNIDRNGFAPAVYNRTASRTDEFIAKRGTPTILPTRTIEEFVGSLERPRRILLMVKAGAPVDAVIDELSPLLEEGDILIDGGNSYFLDTERRSQLVADRGFNFVGMGVSGGEEGALWGPSLMPGGPAGAYAHLEPMLTAIAAKSDTGPCVTHIGPGGSGHYVKMVHNGIEYGDMQLIAETYDILRQVPGASARAIGDVFATWNTGILDSFLVEITAKILQTYDPDTDRPLVDLILDQAEQKGTGRWTSQNSYELGTPIPVINAAVDSRNISSMKEKRVAASSILTGPDNDPNHPLPTPELGAVVGMLEQALYVAKISSYAQGMALLRSASEAHSWSLNYGEIARIWKAGCIIRAKLLDPISRAFEGDPELDNLMLDSFFAEAVNKGQAHLRSTVRLAIKYGVPVAAHSAALAYIDAYRQANSPLNLVQAQRDYFGAHTYRRIDKDGVFHTEWTDK